MRFQLYFVVLPMLLCSCGGNGYEPAIQACEKFIEGSLKSPSTYKRVSANVDQSAVMYAGKSTKSVSVSYDAANAFGTPIRAAEICRFEVDQNGAFVGGLDTAAVIASADRALGKTSDCCVAAASTSPADSRN